MAMAGSTGRIRSALATAGLLVLAACGSADDPDVLPGAQQVTDGPADEGVSTSVVSSTIAASTTVAPATTASTTTATTTTPPADDDETKRPPDTAAIDDVFDDPSTAEEFLELLGDDVIARVGGIDCATELAEIFVAAEAYVADLDAEPPTLADIEPYLGEPIELWVWVDEEETIIPAPGSGCVDLDDTTEASVCASRIEQLDRLARQYVDEFGRTATIELLVDADWLASDDGMFEIVDGQVVPMTDGSCGYLPADVLPADPPDRDDCRADLRTLEVGIEAHVAQYGAEPLAETDLVAVEFLRAISTFYDFADGTIVVQQGGGCDDWPPEAFDPIASPTQPTDPDDDVGITTTVGDQECEFEGRTAVTAIEAYYAQTGDDPDDEQALIDAGFLRAELEHYDVLFGDIVPLDGCPYPEW